MKPKDHADLNALEEQHALIVASGAQEDAAGAITSTLAALAEEALAENKHNTQTGRMDAILGRVRASIDNDALSAAALISGIIRSAKIDGYTDRLTGLAHIYNNDDRSPAQVDVAIEADDINELNNWPILGHASNTWAGKIAEDLVFAVHGIIGEVGMGAIKPAEMAARLVTVNETHAMHVRNMATNAYLAGTAAAQHEWTASFR